MVAVPISPPFLPLAEKLEAQKQMKPLWSERGRKRRELFDAHDKIDAQRDELIGKIEMQLHSRQSVARIFVLRWAVA